MCDIRLVGLLPLFGDRTIGNESMHMADDVGIVNPDGRSVKLARLQYRMIGGKFSLAVRHKSPVRVAG